MFHFVNLKYLFTIRSWNNNSDNKSSVLESICTLMLQSAHILSGCLYVSLCVSVSVSIFVYICVYVFVCVCV